MVSIDRWISHYCFCANSRKTFFYANDSGKGIDVFLATECVITV